jgi:N-acetylneuraminic acid mutarotase
MKNMSLMNSLPNEILSYIASFLAPTDLKSCNSVCERFCAICHDYSLWRRFFVDVNTTSCPAGRLCHTSVVNNNKMYIYGGHITQVPSSEYFHTVKNDMFECNLNTREWREVPSGEGGPRRTEHTAVVHNNTMVVFGGYSGAGYENSAMVFDFETSQWQQLATSGECPSARSAHTAVVVGHSMFVFGGWNGVHCMNDLHELNFETNTWSLICADTSQASRISGSANHAHSIHSQAHAGGNANAGEMPSARCSHGAVVFPAGDAHSGLKAPVMYVFGGYAIEGANESPNKGYLDDLYEFHFDTKKWYRSQTWGASPSPRSRFRMIPFRDSIYLFAGWNSAKHFSTLHKYSITNKQWVEVQTTFDADGIGQFSMVEFSGIMYVFSGFSPKAGCRTNLFAYPLIGPNLQKQAH